MGLLVFSYRKPERKSREVTATPAAGRTTALAKSVERKELVLNRVNTWGKGSRDL